MRLIWGVWFVASLAGSAHAITFVNYANPDYVGSTGTVFRVTASDGFQTVEVFRVFSDINATTSSGFAEVREAGVLQQVYFLEGFGFSFTDVVGSGIVPGVNVPVALSISDYSISFNDPPSGFDALAGPATAGVDDDFGIFLRTPSQYDLVLDGVLTVGGLAFPFTFLQTIVCVPDYSCIDGAGVSFPSWMVESASLIRIGGGQGAIHTQKRIDPLVRNLAVTGGLTYTLSLETRYGPGYQLVATPEPHSSVMLGAAGLALLMCFARNRRERTPGQPRVP